MHNFGFWFSLVLWFRDKLEGTEKFLAWKYRIGLILKENSLEKYIKAEVVEAKEVEAKEKHEKDIIKEMRIIVFYQRSIDP